MKEIAILMAAGLGSRMRPLTDTVAKPLVKVNGTPLIETVIAALEKRGVAEIYVVTGYRAEQFVALAEKYPNVYLVHNAEYATKNNINSVAVVADKMAASDCFVCEADLFLPNADVLCRELTRSGYFGKIVAGFSDDWVFDTDAAGRITRVGKGGTDCFNMVGISYFRQSDAAKIASAVVEVVKKPENANLFWDEVVDRLVKNGKLDLVVHPVSSDEIIECDTIEDLKKLEAKLK
jgi:CTP:phosphocholine cytidylyltransferase-like protein